MDMRVMGLKDEIINGTSDFELYAPATFAYATLQQGKCNVIFRYVCS